MQNQYLDKRVLVTGGAGFIGSHLVDGLLNLGAEVYVLDNLCTGALSNLGRHFSETQLKRNQLPSRSSALTSHVSRLTLFLGDIRDLEICNAACDGVELVFHLAALGSVPRSLKNPATTIAVNVTGTANVFSAARDAGIRRLVYASSSSVFGDSDKLPKKEGEEGKPLSPYAESKVMNERLAEVFSDCFELEFFGLRFFNVYGPRQSPDGPYAAVIPRFFKAFASGRRPEVFGDGEQSRDFTFVDDAVAANLKAAEASPEASGLSYNIAPGSRVTVNELAKAVRDAWGSGLEPTHVDPRPGDVRHSQADPTRAAEQLGFSAEVTLADGLRRTAEWYRGKLRDHLSSSEKKGKPDTE
jgi:nucleoside-diphosphate-sugar epimerase